MNNFERTIADTLLETVYFEWIGTKSDITANVCKESTESYSMPFQWSNEKIVDRSFRGLDLPSELISEACKFAWEQVDWEKVAMHIRNNVY